MISVILQSWKGLKPQDKVVYLHWIWCTREQRNVFLSIASLAEKLKIKESTVRGSVTRLCMCDKVISNDEQSSYAVAYPAGFDSSQAQPEEKLDSVLAILGIGSALRGERAEVLAKRLFRAVLVSLTDDLGIIESVSFSYLSSITGMTVQRLRRYKNELVADRFILKFVAGCNAPFLYKKSHSICIIDPTVFGGSRIELMGFKAEKMLGCEPNQRIKSLRSQGQKGWNLLLDEIIRHSLLGRLNHFFDELVSQNIRDKLTPDYHACSRDIIALTNLKSANNDLCKIWLRDIEHFSDFFLSIVRQQITKSKSQGPFDIYFIRTETSCYLLSNIGCTHTGEIKAIDSDTVVF
ncbi:hypothetical protein [Vibrio parahaemolyticus]|uniref:hypothetical protein n=1 Tax=Vibrio parahaemolyticus TaxID=670 RepID=UPI0022EB2B94|nr:hypothetical protein [Vibrio parahaemolyticus]